MTAGVCGRWYAVAYGGRRLPVGASDGNGFLMKLVRNVFDQTAGVVV